METLLESQTIQTQPTLVDVQNANSQSVLNYLFIVLILSAIVGQSYATFRLNNVITEINASMKLFVGEFLVRLNNLMSKGEVNVHLDTFKKSQGLIHDDIKNLILKLEDIKIKVDNIHEVSTTEK